MDIVILTALGVGGATAAGALIGFLFRGLSGHYTNPILAFAAGVMLAATFLGLLLPALEFGSIWALMGGIWAGSLCMELPEYLLPKMRKKSEKIPGRRHVLMFVTAIAIHNFPEGIAAGVSFGTGSIQDALFIAGGIALQNIPEGIVIIAPMLSAGICPRKTLAIALSTGLIEVIGTLIGYFAVTAAKALLPFSLAFAAGTMLFVIISEIIPQTHQEEAGHIPPYCLIGGFCLMLLCDHLLN